MSVWPMPDSAVETELAAKIGAWAGRHAKAMAVFKFKLQPLLRQRELAEQERQREFAALQGRLVAEQQELKRLDETVRNAVTDLRNNQLTGVLNLSFLAAHRRFMTAMQRQGVAQLEKVEAAKKVAEAARLRLLEAAKQKKIIEKLLEQQQAAWAAVIAKKETADLDEIATQMSTVSIREDWRQHASPIEPEAQP